VTLLFAVTLPFAVCLPSMLPALCIVSS
jgi:hypothetical protein